MIAYVSVVYYYCIRGMNHFLFTSSLQIRKLLNTAVEPMLPIFNICFQGFFRVFQDSSSMRGFTEFLGFFRVFSTWEVLFTCDSLYVANLRKAHFLNL